MNSIGLSTERVRSIDAAIVGEGVVGKLDLTKGDTGSFDEMLAENVPKVLVESSVEGLDSNSELEVGDEAVDPELIAALPVMMEAETPQVQSVKHAPLAAAPVAVAPVPPLSPSTDESAVGEVPLDQFAGMIEGALTAPDGKTDDPGEVFVPRAKRDLKSIDLPDDQGARTFAKAMNASDDEAIKNVSTPPVNAAPLVNGSAALAVETSEIATATMGEPVKEMLAKSSRFVQAPLAASEPEALAARPVIEAGEPGFAAAPTTARAPLSAPISVDVAPHEAPDVDAKTPEPLVIKFTPPPEVLTERGEAQLSPVPTFENKAAPVFERAQAQPTPETSAPALALRNAIALNTRDAEWGQKLVAQIQKMHSDGVARYDISLRPKNLGDLQVNLEFRGDDTQVRIVTETASAARVLIGAEDRLSQMMDAAGYKLSSFSSSMSSQMGGGQGQAAPNRHNKNVQGNTAKNDGERSFSKAGPLVRNLGAGVSINLIA